MGTVIGSSSDLGVTTLSQSCEVRCTIGWLACDDDLESCGVRRGDDIESVLCI